MSHLTQINKNARRRHMPRKAIVLWCDGKPDGFCYSLEIHDGSLGVAIEGGISGDLTRFIALLPLPKGS